MSERYWTLGVELGLLIALPDRKERERVVDKIIRSQFITNVRTDRQKEKFKRIMKEIVVTE